MRPPDASLIDLIGRDNRPHRDIATADQSLRPADLFAATSLSGARDQLADRSVLIFAGDQLQTAAALIELDGLARRLTLCPSDLDWSTLRAVARVTEADAIVYDGAAPPAKLDHFAIAAPCRLPLQAAPPRRAEMRPTEWALLTSGTTGVPKAALHDLQSLAGAFAGAKQNGAAPNWATFYDIRRYGGLQIFFRGVLGGGSLTLTSPGEALEEHLERLARRGVTHISGTPSHWRRVLMSNAAKRFAPSYVRLSGEIADDAVLANLRELYPQARIGHAYASTEAGVAFEVTDERSGFPLSFLGEGAGGVAMKIEDGSLRIRSPRVARSYIGAGAAPLRDADGFVDTGDMVEIRGDRCFFAGRRGGVINVGGAKVHPEEVEAVINLHDRVRMSLVKARANPITGALVVADVVLDGYEGGEADIREDILATCRARLPPYKVPAMIRFVPKLAMTATGKLARNG
ncbi:MAG TPA: class I adenylate-forming enzyme family protein [Roseiarcus sp.]|nr:class I adenylate-forming enzyme family protein [Roseiarcus sp.]